MDEAWFKARYEADAANRRLQSRDDYLSWVAAFYEGRRLPPVEGWEGRQARILARLAGSGRERAEAALEGLGRLLASEWAKDNAARRVSTADLRTYGGRLSEAAGDLESLLAAVEEVGRDLASRGVATSSARSGR